MSKFSKSIFGLLAVALVSTPVATLPTSGWAQVGNIVVKTRKRDENLQDIPISVSTFSETAIEQQGIYNVEEIARLSPSLVFDEGFGPTDNRISIRGLSQTRGRPSAAVLVDGIDLTSESVSIVGGGSFFSERLLDLERVEIVKGPQSALYGRSAFAGALQYITKDPSMDGFEFYGGFEVGSNDRYSVDGGVSGPVVEDIFSVGLNGSYWSEDGFYNHPATGENVGGTEGWGLAGSFLLEPNDAVRLKARISYLEDEHDTRSQTTIRHNVELLPSDPANGVSAGCATGDPMIDPFSASTCGRIHPLFFGNIGDADGLFVNASLDPRTGSVYEGQSREIFRATLVGEWDLGMATLSSWTGYTNADNRFMIDGDFDAEFVGSTEVSLRAQEFDFIEDTEQFSQELRLSSNFDGPFQATVGGLYWYEDANQSGNSKFSDIIAAVFGPVAVPNANTLFPLFDTRRSMTRRETTHWSAYAMVEYELTDQIKVTAEARYGRENIESTGSIGLPQDFIDNTFFFPVPDGLTDPFCVDSIGFPCFGPSFPDLGDLGAAAGGAPPPTGVIRLPLLGSLTERFKEDYFAPRFSIEYTPTDDLLLYFSYAKGIKPGGISTTTGGTFFDPNGDGSASEFSFRKEKLRSYEIGLKGTWLDGTVLTNVSGFFQKFTDKQVGTRGVIPPSPIATGLLVNAGEAEIWGIEFDGQWQPMEGLNFNIGYTFLDTEYTDFVIDSTSATAALRAGNCTVALDPDSGSPECLVSMNGNRIERVPQHALSLLGRYSHSFGPLSEMTGQDIDWFIEANGNYQGKRYLDEANTKLFNSYWLADVRVGLQSENWDLLFYVDNVFKNNTIKTGTNAGGDVDATLTPGTFVFSFAPADNVIANLPDPRTWGFRANFRF